jgi:hypothetical protein
VERLKLLAASASVCALAVMAIGSSATGAKKPDAVDVALTHVQKNARALGLRRSDLRGLRVSDRVTSRHTGVTHVYLQQVHRGIDVASAMMTVNVTKRGKVLSVGNRFVPNLVAAAAGQQVRDATEATLAAARHVGLKPKGLRALKRGTDAARETVLSSAGISRSPLRAQLMWHQLREDSLRLAWNVFIDEADGQHAWTIFVDAQNGSVLAAQDEVVHDNAEDVSNAIARTSDVSAAAAILPATTVADGSSYRVYELAKESPSDGDRTLVSEPASALASPFGWHDTNGVSGAEFFLTRGNNVHAYTDRDNNNITDPGSDPIGGAGLDFDFPLDLDDRPFDYKDAAVTNLFYWNNVVHDLLYNYGFNEVSGNFQVNNYGRGGVGNDDVRAEAQDGSGRNNANFFTPVEGQRPRMQMFEWRSSAPNPIVVHAPSPIAGTYFGPMGGFGESLVTTGPISGEVVYVGRGCDPAYPVGNTPPIPLDPYLADPAGKIALIDRGTCTFVSKVKKAQDRGALMVIVANNAPGPATAMGGADPTVTIPSVMVTQGDGNLFRSNVPFNATISDGTGGAPDRDSDLDAGVIAHEYGHGVSQRLTGGPNKPVINCLNNNEQMGEGWSDYYGITFTSHPGDTPLTARGVGSYVVFQPADGAGIRPRPYTTDMSVNEFTYASIPGGVASGVLTIPHGIGFVWNSMLWEVYWNLVRKHGYNANIYDAWHTGGNNLAIQLVTDGLKLQVCRPGFVDGRNAILAADVALTGGDNQCEIWRGFAKRGLGFSASQGSSNDVNDGVAAFDMPATCSTAAQHYQSYDVSQPELGGETVGLSDQFGSRTVRLEEIEWLMNPASKQRTGGETSPILRPDEHYTCHGFTVPSYTERSLRVTNQFVTDSTVRIGRPLALCTPAQKRTDLPPVGLPPLWQQHYECYDVRTESPRFTSETVTVTDQFGTRSARLDRARELCVPAEKRRTGLPAEPILNEDELYVCYRIVSHTPTFTSRTAFTHDQFRQDALNVVSPRRLCVPSEEVTATPS